MNKDHYQAKVGLVDTYWLGVPTSVALPDHVRHFPSLDKLFEYKRKPEKCIIIVNESNDTQDGILSKLRAHEKTCLSTILVINNSKLSDFYASHVNIDNVHNWLHPEPDREDKFGHIQKMHNKVDRIILSFLYNHKNQPIKPLLNPSSFYLYDYPLLTLYNLSPLEQRIKLKQLTRKSILKVSKLVNRYRSCNKCQSTHLNFIDCCPSCLSFQIVKHESLHCFNCGHVSSEQSFQTDTGLQCPNCLQQLLHIGVDFDRPIEDIHCEACLGIFHEATVLAVCLHCQNNHKTDELVINQTYEYTLENDFIDKIKAGQRHNPILFTPKGFVTLDHFNWHICWQSQLCEGFKKTSHLVCLTAINLDALYVSEGVEYTFNLVNELKRRLQYHLSNTDICCQLDDERLFILLTPCHTGNDSQIESKVSALRTLNSDSKLVLKFKIKAIPKNRIKMDLLDLAKNIE